MARRLRYGLIGGGMMGQEHIRNLALFDEAEVSVVVEPDPGMRAAVRSLLPDVVLLEKIDEFVGRDDIDCAVIASPNFRHVEQLELIAANMNIPVLCEKPLYTDPDDRSRIGAIERLNAGPVWVAMEYRYMPPIAAFLKQVDAATGGIRMITIREHRFPFLTKVGDWNRFNRNSGGTLVEKCCHHFDLMRFALGSDPVRVMASAGQDVNHLDEVYDGERSDIWDNGYVIVDFTSGARGMLDLCMFAEGSQYQEEITAIGAKGKLECFVPGPARLWNRDIGPLPVPKLIESPRNPTGPVETDIPVDPALLTAGDHNGATYFQHQRFLRAAKGEGPVEVSLDDGRWAVAMGIAAQRAAAEGRVVEMDEVLG